MRNELRVYDKISDAVGWTPMVRLARAVPDTNCEAYAKLEFHHTRRMFGGGLPAAWPFAAVALHYFETFEADYARAVRTANEFFSLLKQESAFDVETIPNGSNLFKLSVRGTDLETFRYKLRSKGILLSRPRPEFGGFLVGVNATLNRTDASTLAKIFQESL